VTCRAQHRLPVHTAHLVHEHDRVCTVVDGRLHEPHGMCTSHADEH